MDPSDPGDPPDLGDRDDIVIIGDRADGRESPPFGGLMGSPSGHQIWWY